MPSKSPIQARISAVDQLRDGERRPTENALSAAKLKKARNSKWRPAHVLCRPSKNDSPSCICSSKFSDRILQTPQASVKRSRRAMVCSDSASELEAS